MTLARALIATMALVGVAGAPTVAIAEDRPAAPRAGEVPTLDALLERCSKMPGLTARFVEEKQIALLAVPLRSTGTLHFARGRGLVRHTLEPSKQSVLIDDKELVLWDGRATKHVSLASSPAVETFARAFSLILAADRPALEQRFVLDFRREGASFRLKLVPKGPELKNVLTAIELEGEGLLLSTLRIREASGDVSTTRFSDVDVTKRYSDEEAIRVFRMPPA